MFLICCCLGSRARVSYASILAYALRLPLLVLVRLALLLLISSTEWVTLSAVPKRLIRIHQLRVKRGAGPAKLI